jgi:Ca2+-binding EF-hand superfamily protein
MGACSSSKALVVADNNAELLDTVLKKFDEHDHDGSGAIETKELAALIEDVMGEAPDEDTMRDAVKVMDPNGDGEIAWSEFKDWFFDDEAKGIEKKPEDIKPPPSIDGGGSPSD